MAVETVTEPPWFGLTDFSADLISLNRWPGLIAIVPRHVVIQARASADLPRTIDPGLGLVQDLLEVRHPPGMRPMAKITANISFGIPIARHVIPQ